MFTQLTTTLTLLCLIFGTNLAALSMPVYTDEIPQEHLNRVKSVNNDNNKSAQIQDAKPEQEVRVYSNEKVVVTYVKEKVNGKYVKIKGRCVVTQNILISDQIDFIIADDVLKNGKLYIKKGTIATGIVSNAEPVFPGKSAPSELQIQNFKTKDVNANSVNLYGKIEEIGHEAGIVGYIIGIGNISTSATIDKDKIYTLYYK